jgi:hypothetical protein
LFADNSDVTIRKSPFSAGSCEKALLSFAASDGFASSV